MQPDNDLDSLAVQHGSDKFGSHWYTRHYHQHFSSLRENPVQLLEIGIGGYDDPNYGGASLRMWRDYFPSGMIYGLDFYDKVGVQEDRIKTFKGSQGDPRALASIVASNPNELFDIIIDDGSHRSEHVISTFLSMFQFVTDGGWYVVEDTQTSYWPDYGGHSDGQGPLTMIPFFKSLVDGLNWREIHRPGYAPSYFDLNVGSVQFLHNMIFIQKGQNTEESNVLVGNRLPYV